MEKQECKKQITSLLKFINTNLGREDKEEILHKTLKYVEDLVKTYQIIEDDQE